MKAAPRPAPPGPPTRSWARAIGCAWGLLDIAAWAQEPPPGPPPTTAAALERVEIRSARDDSALRRQSTAAKIVVGHDEIEKFGDSNVTEVLKRLPGVTVGGAPGRGGEIRLRGLGSGYTQILVNGERMPAGFSLDTLMPEQIERIEILRAPSAEFGAQAIAGTLNIVLRQDSKRRLNTLTATLGFENGRPQPALAWARADSRGDFSHDLSAGVFRNSRLDRSTTQTASSSTGSKLETSASRTHREGLHASGRLQWKLGEGESFALLPSLFHIQAQSWAHSEVTPATADPYGATLTPGAWYYSSARNTAQWQLQPGIGGKLDAKLGGYVSRWGSDSDRREFDASGAQTRQLVNLPRASDNGLNANGKYSRLLDNDHQLAAGWDLDMSWRRESQSATDSAAPTLSEEVGARRWLTALWGQDEWALTPQWSLHAGLRWESIRTQSSWDEDGTPTRVSNLSSVWSPLLHALWRPEADSRDQVRISLTRSYKAPTTQQLVAKRAVSRTYPTTETNTPLSADRLGNPRLLPELATGIDLAYEHYLPGSGLVSMGLFHRTIQHLIRNVTTDSAQNYAWAQAPRYVSTPVNLDSATTTGVELEAKLRLSELWPAAPATDLRGNVSLFRSRVRGIPGPNNTLDRQPPYTANVGVDHKLRDAPVTVGANLNFTPGYGTRQSAQLSTESGVRRALDVYGNWNLSPGAVLRLSANNLLPRWSQSGSTYVGNGATERSVTMEPTSAHLSLRLQLQI